MNPCAACTADGARQRRDDADNRVAAAGFPRGLLGFRLHERGVVAQSPGEPEERFQERVRHHPERPLGILRRNRDAMAQLYRWRPPAWAVLYGTSGTGKTAVMTAMAWRMLDAPTDSWVPIDHRQLGPRTEATAAYLRARRLDRRLVRRPPPSATYLRAADLVDRGRDRGDRRSISAASTADGVLFLDEIGVGKPSAAERQAVQRVICRRSDLGLATVVAANCSWEALTGSDALYGPRVADRLSSALRVPLTGRSWRARS
ncbi:MAG: hypothetical protein KTR31_38820 [Myxococcales bacterium]|nr:hypothetical protein [Myxococcales bacterium]